MGDIIDIKLEEKLKSKLSPIRKDIKNDIKRIIKVVEDNFAYHEKHSMHVVKNIQEIQRHLDMSVVPSDPPANFKFST